MKAAKALLVRMLSTGRTGTKYMAKVFEDQGYFSVHEDFYAGEPFVAIKHYANMLGDMWMEDPDKYFELQSNFAQPYVDALSERVKSNQLSDELAKEKRGVVVHSGHLMTPASPLVMRELESRNISVKHLILLRNPLKTIHAIFTIESEVKRRGQRPYRIRPQHFSQDEGYLGAAQIWANSYRMIADQRNNLGQDLFKVLWLENFSRKVKEAQDIFDFLGLDFDKKRFAALSKQVLENPLRAEKVDSVRNSDLYIQPDFSFSESQIAEIQKEISDVLEKYKIDWAKNIEEYLEFHAKEKAQLGFK
jgi:hypothetical protein